MGVSRDEACGLPLPSPKDGHQAHGTAPAKSQREGSWAGQAPDFGLSLPASFTPSLSYAFQHQALHSVLENEGHPAFSGGTAGNRKTILGVSCSCQVGGGGVESRSELATWTWGKARESIGS